MLSAAFTDVFPGPTSGPGSQGALASVPTTVQGSLIKREVCSDDEEIEVGKESDMDEDPQGVSPTPVQDMPEDLSVKKKETGSASTSSSRPSSISPPTRSSESGSPDSGKDGSGQNRAKRIKPIPPPLDLNARTLSPSDTGPAPAPTHQPLSPAPREALPLRKR